MPRAALADIQGLAPAPTGMARLADIEPEPQGTARLDDIQPEPVGLARLSDAKPAPHRTEQLPMQSMMFYMGEPREALGGNFVDMVKNVPGSAYRMVDDTATIVNRGLAQMASIPMSLMPDTLGGKRGNSNLDTPGYGWSWAAKDVINRPGKAWQDAKAIGGHLKDYYWDEGVGALLEGRLGKSFVEDPVGIGLDLGGAVFGLGKGIARKAASLGPRGLPSASKLQQSVGRLSEAIGPGLYDRLQRNGSSLALAKGAVHTDIARYTLKPWLTKIADSIPYLRTGPYGMGRGLIYADKLRKLVNRIPKVGEMLAAKLGLTHGELQRASTLAEVIRAQPLDEAGNLRLGVWEKGAKDKEGWRHGLDPEAARAAMAEMSPDAQKLIMAYVEPAKGYHTAPKLPMAGEVAGPAVDIPPRAMKQPDPLEAMQRIEDSGHAQEAGQGPLNLTEAVTRGRVAKGKLIDLTTAAPEVTAQEIGRLYEQTLASKPVGKAGVVYRSVSPEEAAALKKVTGLDLAGYRHTLDNYSINHIHKQHGNPAKEAARGQLPVTKEDVQRIPEIITTADRVSLQGKTKIGRPVIVYEKRFNGWVYFVEEQRTGKKELAAVTLYKKRPAVPRATGPGGGSGVAHTSETFRRSTSNIASTDGTNKAAVMLPHPARPLYRKPGNMSREVNYQEFVDAGVLESGQHVEGYVTHMGATPEALDAARISKRAPEIELSPMVPGMAQHRINGLGNAPALDDAIRVYRTAAEEAKHQKLLLRDIGPMILEPLPKTIKLIDGKPVEIPVKTLPAEAMVRSRTEWDPWAGKEITRQEPLTLVEVAMEEAEALGVQPGRYMIPNAFVDRFDVLLGRIKSGKLDTPLEGFKDLVRDLARYWKANVLVAPGTVGTNFLGGATQYMGKVAEDLLRGDLRKVGQDLAAPVRALGPKAVERIPEEILGRNVANQFDLTNAIFAKNVQRRMEMGEPVRLSVRALARLDQALGVGLKLALTPFGWADNFWKRSIYLSELRSWAKGEAGRLHKAGKAGGKTQGELTEELAAEAFRSRPGLHKEIMQGPVDAFAYDYANIPGKLEKFRDSTTGALTVPFPIYPYKYARMLGRQANAFNPANKIPMRERLARGGSLVASTAGPYALGKYLFGKSEVQEGLDQFARDYPDTKTEVAYPYLGGREMIESFTGEDGRPKERFLRTAKYAYLNLPKAFHSWKDFAQFLDEFKSTGPAVTVAANLLGFVPREFGARDLPGQLGELVSGYVPAHRMLEFVAKVNDEFRKRSPRGFWENMLGKFPGGRKFIHQPVDKWNRELGKQDRFEEWLKFLSGINLKTVDVVSAKEALSEAVTRASDRGMKDSVRLDYYQRYSGLALHELEPWLDKIKAAEKAAVLKYREMESKVFYAAVLKGLDAMDPDQAAGITQLKRKVGREAVTQGLGMKNQNNARQALRIMAGMDWIETHLKGGKQ